MDVEGWGMASEDTTVHVEPPRDVDSDKPGGESLRVPWHVQFDKYQHGNVVLAVETRAKLEEIRDAITAALDANPDAP